jgi:hypothetical protein
MAKSRRKQAGNGVAPAALEAAQAAEVEAAETVAAIEARISKEQAALAEGEAATASLAQERAELDARVLDVEPEDYRIRLAELEERTRKATVETTRRRATITALQGRLAEAQHDHDVAVARLAGERWQAVAHQPREASERLAATLEQAAAAATVLIEARATADARRSEFGHALDAIGEDLPYPPPKEFDEVDFRLRAWHLSAEEEHRDRWKARASEIEGGSLRLLFEGGPRTPAADSAYRARQDEIAHENRINWVAEQAARGFPSYIESTLKSEEDRAAARAEAIRRNPHAAKWVDGSGAQPEPEPRKSPYARIP